jgi:hypothetical protein
LRWDFHLTRRVFWEEVLIGCLSEDVPQVRPHLKHSVLGLGLSQLVEVDLQCEFVEVLQRDILEIVDEVLLDQQRLHLCSFFFPARFLQRKEAVANEPSKGDGAVVYGSTARSMSVLFSDLSCQRFPRLKLCQLSLEAENNRNDSAFRFAAYGVDYVTAKVAVPFLAARNDPSLLVRFAHYIASISVGGNERATSILPGFSALSAPFPV